MNAPTVSWRKPQKCRWKLMPQPDIEETAAAAAATHSNVKKAIFCYQFLLQQDTALEPSNGIG